MAEELIDITIVPEIQRYYNEDSHWGVYVFSTDDKIPHFFTGKDPYDDKAKPKTFGVMSGTMQQLTIGMKYGISARIEYSKKYKQWQYVPQIITSLVPKTEQDQISYLKTQTTELQAENILKIYPNVVADIMEGKELDPAPIKGVGQKTWDKIVKNVIDNFAISEILVMLQPLGVTYKAISKLLESYSSPDLLKQDLMDNPYILTKVRGMGFRRVDDIALKLNPQIKESTKRMVAFVNYYLRSVAADSGNTWVPLDQLNNAVQNEILECYDIYQNFVEQQKVDGRFLIIKGNHIGLKKYHDNELKIVSLLDSLNKGTRQYKLNIEEGIKEAERVQGFQFTAEQVEVIKQVCQSNVALYTGKSGTGKSSILRAITTIYSKSNCLVSCCALSAKAAQRISETTNRPASTIHRLLGYKGKKFSYDMENKMPIDVVIVDEASMINAEIFLALVSAIRDGARIIMCGDDGQLPPIGEGNVFHDLLGYNHMFTCLRLTKILRQAERSGIVSDAAKIRNNISPLKKPETKVVTGELQDMTYMFRDNREGMRELAIKLYLNYVTKDRKNLDNIVIITPCKQNRTNSTFEINSIIQDQLIPPNSVKSIRYGAKEFRIGSKVIQRANNYEKNVFNGEVGYVIDIFKNGKETIMQVDFGKGKVKDFEQPLLENIDLAYALTCHLTQGSEYPFVICIIDNTHFKLLDSCLLYTAITRAKSKCLLLAEPSAFRQCIVNKASDRNTWLDYYNNERKSEIV